MSDPGKTPDNPTEAAADEVLALASYLARGMSQPNGIPDPRVAAQALATATQLYQVHLGLRLGREAEERQAAQMLAAQAGHGHGPGPGRGSGPILMPRR
jgi:hypothetical protein